ncbi:outer membrane protein assembly factor BamA [Desulfurobacterium atlanticum]|uniref:Outer membrane protein assembly factor BamA n=1 Tax=Desulfurobacterium atlanticum TaxID=240169 RepID=A0A238XRM5_9BACT|nr:outer membrane protein assembly factor BamA [Desulfurobacterium atlanticum]SNR61218.1 Beta-barrel assembly machine subunit BamA [Desulfurobacterium atlanticum]
MKKFIFIVLLLLSTCGVSFSQTNSTEITLAPVIKEIKIEGNTYLPKETILYKISVKPGQHLNPEKVAEDIRSIYYLGFYKTIKVVAEETPEGLVLKYILYEKPKVEAVEFKGNEEISTKTIKEKIGFDEGNFTGKVLDYGKLEDLRSKIEKLYKSKGYLNVKVKFEVEKIAPKKVNVVYQIEEGKKAYVCRVVVKGNKALKEDEIKDMILTKEPSIWRLRFHPELVEENLEKDVRRIEKLYKSKGYIEIEVGKPQVKQLKNCYEVVYTIKHEGPQYKIGTVNVSGNRIITRKKLLSLVPDLTTGKPYNPELLTAFVVKASREYGKYGFIFVNIQSDTKIDRKKHTVDITFLIHEGNRAKIRRINIKGNFDSRDRTVRRELDIYETGIFKTDSLERSIRRLYNTGYYDEVNVKPKIVGKDLLDVDIDLKERLTGMFSIGLGYSSVTNLTAMISLRKGNLFGTGDTISVSGQFGSKVAYYDVAYSHKWWLDRPQTLSFRVFNHKNEYTTYTSLKKGFSINLSRRLGKDWNVGVGYTISRTTISDIDPNATSIITEEEGTSTVAYISSRAILDLRDNRFLPHRGFMFAIADKIAGKAFGGDDNFYTVVVDISKHIYLDDFSEKHKIPVVLSGHLKIGYAGTYGDTENVPIDYRFYVGGDTTVRGFRWGEAGPVDENGDPIGANRELVANFEVGYDISRNLRFIGFFDIGAGWWNEIDLSTLRKAAGFGMRVLTPVGPIRLDIGYKLDKKPGETASEWHFGLGTYF